jgi:TonB family protein
MYARSLLRVASLLAAGTPDRTLHAIGIFDANIFERRVMSLTEKRVAMKGARRIVTAAACVVIGVATCASAMALRMDVGAPTEVATQSGSGAPIKVQSDVMAGNILFKKNPVYPAEAKANNDTLDGSVVLRAMISKEGTIKGIQLVKGLRKDYDTSAMDAVKDWRYKPYLLNGEPTEVDTTITVTYWIGK